MGLPTVQLRCLLCPSQNTHRDTVTGPSRESVRSRVMCRRVAALSPYSLYFRSFVLATRGSSSLIRHQRQLN